jgi:hypothetical protein
VVEEMLGAAVAGYERVVRALPGAGEVNAGYPRGLESAAAALGLGATAGQIRGKALALGLILTAVFAISAFLASDISLLILGVLIPCFSASLVVMIPLALFRVKKARLASEAVSFLLAFSTMLRHANQEEAYAMASESLESEPFRRARVKLELGELTSIPGALGYLAGEMRPYSARLYSAFRGAASEVQREEPDYGGMLRDSLSALQTENGIELGRFAERFRAASAVVSFTPVTFYLALPFASAFLGYSVDAAFLAASIAVVAVALAAVLYLLSVYPPSASFADLGGVDRETALLLGVEFGPSSGIKAVVACTLLFLLSLLSSAFLVAMGLVLVGFAIRNSCIDRLLDAVKGELASLPLEMKEISYRLRRGEPLEKALSSSSSLAVRAALFRASRRVFPEGTFSLFEDVLQHLRHSGEALAGTLEELGGYVREVLEYRSVMSARMEDVRGYMFLLYILLPVLSLFSLWAFSFMAEVSRQGAEATSYFGFEGLTLISRPPDIEKVLSVMAPALIASMLLFTLLSVMCEDIVAPQLLKARTGMLGVGVFILGLGEILLVGL